MTEKVEIKSVKGHYEVYLNDIFFCSADSYLEAAREYDEMENKYE